MRKLGFYSNLPIEDGDKVVAFLATSTVDVEYANGFESILPILFPLFGEYDQDSETLRNIETTHCKRLIRKTFQMDNPSDLLEKFNNFNWENEKTISKSEFFKNIDIRSKFLDTCDLIILFEHVAVYESILDQLDNILYDYGLQESEVFKLEDYLNLKTKIDYGIPKYLNKDTITEELAKEIMEFEKFNNAFSRLGGEYKRSDSINNTINPRVYWRIKETMSDLMFSKIEE